MMRLLSRFISITLFCSVALPVSADYVESQYNSPTKSDGKNQLQYFLNLGNYLGYELTKSPSELNITVSQTLISMPEMQVMNNYLLNTFFGATPVNAMSKALSLFLPDNIAGASIINAFANYTFTTQSWSSPSSQGGTVTVSKLIDQAEYQQDPISQAVLNILGTPDFSFCMTNGSTWEKDCPLLFQNKVMTNVIGTFPKTREFFEFEYNKKFISQLNTNSLIAPLMYTVSNTGNSTSSGNPNQQKQGLTAQSQAEQAANFIRYVSGALTPLDLPKFRDYDRLYIQALNEDNKLPKVQQMQAQATLARYLTNVRVYAAQSSVGLANLYYILSKRLPQTQGTDNNAKASSQALSEFNMATWRLFKPEVDPDKQWIKQLNDASPATVQKEIATLLAEINYQLYLNRQQEERILLTNSIALLQSTRANQPSPDLIGLSAVENSSSK